MAYDQVDTHFHIWNLEKFEYPWPTPDLAPLYKNYDPKDLMASKAPTPVKHAVFVQCLNACPEEAKWVFELSKAYPFIKGVVAGIDLTDTKLEDILDDLRTTCPLFVGVRHILDMEDEDWITREDVICGLKILEKRQLTYDLLLRPHHLKYVPTVAKQVPNLKMVVDHIAKPFIKKQVIDGWKEGITETAKFPNIYCKISGLVPEGEPGNVNVDHYAPYVKHVLEVFGAERCMFGSDWPVSHLVNVTYQQVHKLASDLISHLTPKQQQMIFRDNATKFYNLQGIL